MWDQTLESKGRGREIEELEAMNSEFLKALETPCASLRRTIVHLDTLWRLVISSCYLISHFWLGPNIFDKQVPSPPPT